MKVLQYKKVERQYKTKNQYHQLQQSIGGKQTREKGGNSMMTKNRQRQAAKNTTRGRRKREKEGKVRKKTSM